MNQRPTRRQHPARPRPGTARGVSAPEPDIVRPGASARDVASVVLDDYKRTGEFVSDLLNRHDRTAALGPDDRRLAMELTGGIVRRQATLDVLISSCVRRPRGQVETGLWNLLQLGAYQLIFLESIPAYAAIHETVETARHRGHPDWTGFLNGVLRGISRLLTDVRVAAPAADALPLSDGLYRKLQEQVFAEPAAKSTEYVCQAFSFPEWLIGRWSKRLDFAELCRLGFWFNAPARLTLRANSLRTNRAALLEALRSAGIEARPGTHPSAVLLSGSARVEDLPGFGEGWFAVQDESAMQAAEMLAVQPGWNVLDLCAAPGTKTTHLAELMRNEGQIIAADVDLQRIERITENSRRLGATIIEPRFVVPDGSDIPAGPFDAILVDVPCSNTGVLGKRPEVRWRLSPRDLEELPRVQQRLLSAAIERLKPGGRLVYSTCSIEPEENADVVSRVLSSDSVSGRVRLLTDSHHVPGRPADGGYQALLVREA